MPTHRVLAPITGLALAACSFLAVPLTWAADTDPRAVQVAGYRRDSGGNGSFPAITPPTRNLEVAWQTLLPRHGLSSPIVLGNKVLVTVECLEGVRVFPGLICIDATSGKILWDRELNHIPALPEADREAVAAAWHAISVEKKRSLDLHRKHIPAKEADALRAAGFTIPLPENRPLYGDAASMKKCGFSYYGGAFVLADGAIFARGTTHLVKIVGE